MPSLRAPVASGMTPRCSRTARLRITVKIWPSCRPESTLSLRLRQAAPPGLGTMEVLPATRDGGRSVPRSSTP